jgi:hypothetical protein
MATGRRTAVLADLADQLFSRGRYVGTVEELTPSDDSLESRIPYWGILLHLLKQPANAGAISRNVVAAYALGPRGHAFVDQLA